VEFAKGARQDLRNWVRRNERSRPFSQSAVLVYFELCIEDHKPSGSGDGSLQVTVIGCSP